jgi:hypothetical protein
MTTDPLQILNEIMEKEKINNTLIMQASGLVLHSFILYALFGLVSSCQKVDEIYNQKIKRIYYR